jgi:hypothetical protein
MQKEEGSLGRLAFAASIANEARNNAADAKSFARFALIIALMAFIISLAVVFFC